MEYALLGAGVIVVVLIGAALSFFVPRRGS